MTDRDDFARRVADLVLEEGRMRPPEGALDEIITSTGQVRPLPRWLAFIKEPSMTRSSTLAVGSPTVRAVALLASALLLLALAGGTMAGASRLLASSSVIVSQAGDGDFMTIADAVAATADGGTIEVRPGTYAEAITIEGKDLTIRGSEDRAAVIVEATPVGDANRDHGSAFILQDTDSELRDLTLKGARGTSVVEVRGDDSAPTLTNLAIVSPTAVDSSATDWENASSIVWRDSSAGVLSDSDVSVYVSITDAAKPAIERNALEACVDIVGSGTHPTFSDNTFSGCPHGYLVAIGDGFSEASLPGNAEFIGNEFQLADAERGGYSAGNYALYVMRTDAPVLVHGGNVFRDSMQGIGVRASGSATIEGNSFSGNQIAIWVEGDDAELIGNTITDSSLYGLQIHGSPDIVGNTLDSNLIGINLGATAAPMLSDNTFCDNDTNLKASADNPTTLDGNEVCDSAS